MKGLIKLKNKNKGITLIALVVTIVVLLILAAVSISMLGGENGIITKANESSIATDNSNVKESLGLKISEYDILKNQGDIDIPTLDWLKQKGYINDQNQVNVEKVVGQKLKYGNGINNKDVYIIEEKNLIYYDKSGNKKDLGELNINDIIVSDSNIFKFDKETGFIFGVKDIENNYYDTSIGNTDATFSIAPYNKLVIPNEIDGVKVKGIASRAFGRFIDLEEIVFQDGIQIISPLAFEDCNALSKISFPNSLEYVDIQAFIGTKWMYDKISELENDGENVYGEIILNNYLWFVSTKEDTYVVSDKVKTIGPMAFNMLKEQETIVNLTIPSNVRKIGLRAFWGCSNLSNIIIEEGLEEIDILAFEDCTGLVSITLPNSLTKINGSLGMEGNPYAFAGCENLKNINFKPGNNQIPSGQPWGAPAECVITKLK